ncbi:hypothetical protein MCOR27_003373 [Pyricularia oryzae]|uniref:Uncharacterized protein n=1 Tax=Pyricularia grisea TaxID=148305 RepID=A0ABQ8NPU0_PYRGI|nr:hypothetical protein MCOR01_010713 [Pyricularia oryzae]KAI6300285.1 hypothetical protein MCOR33_003966 [Pyricularia grisea]KAI6259373.1 hypothetical protein MCOR19_004294 [Pyricularia oryzae]KAI6272083.1 hypothetical protein MCOR26_007490 [Pyricularia oryzae]KAI6283207.1 hypothetical protein MCOR27_003373 [Pyricularia oryzae]
MNILGSLEASTEVAGIQSFISIILSSLHFSIVCTASPLVFESNDFCDDLLDLLNGIPVLKSYLNVLSNLKTPPEPEGRLKLWLTFSAFRLLLLFPKQNISNSQLVNLPPESPQRFEC